MLITKSLSTSQSRWNLIILLGVIFLGTACANQQTVKKAPPSKDVILQQGQSLAEVEAFLGIPHELEKFSSSVDKRIYLSKDSPKVYQVTYQDGVVKDFTWTDTSQELVNLNVDLHADVAIGQSKSKVESMLGSPSYITGTEDDTSWWYYMSDSKIYLLKFNNNSLTMALPQTLASLRKHIQQSSQ